MITNNIKRITETKDSCIQIPEINSGELEHIYRKQKNLEAIFDASSVGMILIDEHGIIKRVNNVVLKLVQRDFSEIINKRPGQGLECIHALKIEHECGYDPFCSICPIHKIYKDVLYSWRPAYGIELQAALLIDGKEFNPWLEINAEPTLIDEQKYIVLTIQNVTKRKKAERELERISKHMVKQSCQLTQEVTAADLAQSQFLAKMSHEIRTPINAIIGFSQILEKDILTDEQKHHVGIIQESATHLLELINDLLDFSWVEAGKLNVNIVDCSLEHTFAVLESLMRPQAKAKGLAFQIIQCEQLPVQIRTDPTRLRQCLINVINNAIKFTDKGHVYVYVSLKNIDNKDYICFDIEDTGIGIPNDKHNLVFQEFLQIDGSSTRKYSGTGLGLSITKKLANLLEGDITLKSDMGIGSVFTLILPANVDVQSQTQFNKYEQFVELHRVSNISQKEKFSGNVLVAEDIKSNQMLIKYLLEKFGIEVTIAQNGKEAADKILEKQYDIVFMDMFMPVMDGYETTKLIRKKGFETPIVALTANAMPDDCKKCISAGCNDYLTKPIDNKLLKTILKKYLPLREDLNNEKNNSVSSDVNQINHRESVNHLSVIKKYQDEDLIQEILKTSLENGPKIIELAAVAVSEKNFKNITIYAQKLNELARHIGAKELSSKAYSLECAAQVEDFKSIEFIFEKVKIELEKVLLFLSREDEVNVTEVK